MRLIAILAITTALAACSKPAPAPDATASDSMAADTMASATPTMATNAVTPGAYDVKMKDGSVARLNVMADGAYTMKSGKGMPEAGVVKMVDGKTCYDPSGKAEPMCWTMAAQAADGTVTATSDKGDTAVISVAKM